MYINKFNNGIKTVLDYFQIINLYLLLLMIIVRQQTLSFTYHLDARIISQTYGLYVLIQIKLSMLTVLEKM